MLRVMFEGMVIVELVGCDIVFFFNKFEGFCVVMCGYYEDFDFKSYFEENRCFY